MAAPTPPQDTPGPVSGTRREARPRSYSIHRPDSQLSKAEPKPGSDCLVGPPPPTVEPGTGNLSGLGHWFRPRLGLELRLSVSHRSEPRSDLSDGDGVGPGAIMVQGSFPQAVFFPSEKPGLPVLELSALRPSTGISFWSIGGPAGPSAGSVDYSPASFLIGETPTTVVASVDCTAEAEERDRLHPVTSRLVRGGVHKPD